MLLLRSVVFLVGATVAIALCYQAAVVAGDPSSELQRFREPPAPLPHVLVKGTLVRRSGEDMPALAVVEHERYESCGKHSCWKAKDSFRYSNAAVKVEWSSSPLPATMNIDWSFEEEAWRFPLNVVVSPSRTAAWISFAASSQLRFGMPKVSTGNDRIVEYAADTDDPVTISACVSPTNPNLLEKCPGQADYGVVLNGDDQAARDDGADSIALRIGGAMVALLVAVLAWLRPKKPIVEGLEDRAEAHERKYGWELFALFAVPVVGGVGLLLLQPSRPPSTWASGRTGFYVALCAMTFWLFYLRTRLMRRKGTLLALNPVLTTPRKLLTEASGTVELSVKAKLRNGGVRAFIGDDVVAHSEIKIWETYTQGKNTSKQLVVESRQRNELGVVDESGEGTLNLQRSILEVELRSQTFTALPERYAQRGVVVYPHPRHIKYHVEEHVIKDGESLFVFGDVSGIALQSDEGGYRSVRGSPTLGGADAAPVLVYSGSQKGLVEMLTREARVANSFAVVAICLCGAMALSLGALAML